jgi:hypothetical protein
MDHTVLWKNENHKRTSRCNSSLTRCMAALSSFRTGWRSFASRGRHGLGPSDKHPFAIAGRHSLVTFVSCSLQVANLF